MTWISVHDDLPETGELIIANIDVWAINEGEALFQEMVAGVVNKMGAEQRTMHVGFGDYIEIYPQHEERKFTQRVVAGKAMIHIDEETGKKYLEVESTNSHYALRSVKNGEYVTFWQYMPEGIYRPRDL